MEKTVTKALILFSAKVITLCKFVRTYMKQVMSRPAAKVTGYLPLEINYDNRRLTLIPSIKLETLSLVVVCSPDIKLRLVTSTFLWQVLNPIWTGISKTPLGRVRGADTTPS